MLLLVIPIMTYSKTVSVMVGTKIINKALSLMTMGELAKATMTWRQAHFGAVMSGSLQLSCSSSGKCKVTAGATSSFQQGALWRCRNSKSMTSKVQFAPHRKSQYPHLAQSIYGQTQVSRDTVCQCMF